MIEFNAQEGGRYTYVDDIVNLQDLALSYSALFSECDNFVVSGCEVSGTSISAGYVYINGKLRYFSGATGIKNWPQYIYESNRIENVSYATGADRVGRKVYGCAIAAKIPTTLDAITGKIPSSLLVKESGTVTFKEAFIGKYALLLNSTNQSVAGTVTLADLVTQTLKAESETIQSGNYVARKYYQGANLIYESQAADANYKMTVEGGVGFRFYINDVLIMTIGKDNVEFATRISKTSSGATELGSLVINNGNLFNSTAAVDDATVDINVIGHNGTNAYFRTTNIGDGKGGVVLSVVGSSHQINGNGLLHLTSDTHEGIVLKSTYAKTENSLQKLLVWKDKDNETIGYVGYNSSTDQMLRIANNIASIELTGAEFVNIGPAIQENGTLLSKKYVLSEKLSELVKDKAEAAKVYSKTDANNKFATKDNGFTQFITEENTAEKLRSDIGAGSADDVANCVKKTEFLADMATTTKDKKRICDNIGAAFVGDFQEKLTDTGWQQCSDQPRLYVRQIGHIVSIQGTIETAHEGVAFTIPNSIDAPTHAVYQSVSFSNYQNWSCQIEADTRLCKVIYCNGSCYKDTSFSMTYMV